MKAKLLSFAFFYFSESGLFNGLRTIQIKKSLPVRSQGHRGRQYQALQHAGSPMFISIAP
jgi:hypothetical protein